MEIIAHSIEPLWKVERDAIFYALLQMNGNRTRAAKALGISVRTLRNRLCQYRQSGPDAKPPTLKEARSIKP